MDRRREQLISFGGVIALGLALPIFLRAVNYVNRIWVGAEGRLAAIAVETDHPLGPLPEPWQALAQGGEVLQTFLDNSAPQVKALFPQYIRIDHIYDGFDVVSKDASGLRFDWSKLDQLVGKITDTGAKPFFSLSYMPPSISKGDIIDEPREWGDWQLTVQKTIEHYSGDLGLANVYYEVWNEPDLFGKWTMGGKKDYRQLYSYASKGAARAQNVQDFKFGGPGTTGLYKNWMDGFFPYILENNLRLDFFSWHRYDTDIDKYTEDASNVDAWLDSHPYFSHVEKIVSEMGPSGDKAKVNSSTMGAAHLIAASREFIAKIKYAFSFSVKDGPGNNDGWGLIGSENQTKPRFAAIKLLNKLGDQRLAVTGEGTWVRAIAGQTRESYQVLVVNYDPKAEHSEAVPVTFINLTPGEFILKQTDLAERSSSQQIATSESILQQTIPMLPNTAVLLELTPIASTSAIQL